MRHNTLYLSSLVSFVYALWALCYGDAQMRGAALILCVVSLVALMVTLSKEV
jgi:hypothetical protein